jgi:general secretion pathway protein G
MGQRMDLKIRHRERGFTIAEVVIAAMLTTLLLSMMVPATMNLVDRAKERKVITDLQAIEKRIDDFRRQNSRYPLSLMEVYASMPLDPWDNPYQYLNIADTPGHGEEEEGENGIKARMYKNERFINTDYDLYSMGPDGKSVAPLTAQPSRDDIIRAGNGRFIGRVEDYR